MLKIGILKKASTVSLGALAVVALSADPSQAAVIFDVSSNPAQNLTSAVFTSGGIDLTINNSNATGSTNPGTINFNSAGLCAFAAVGISQGRCGYGNGLQSGGITSFQLSFNKPVFLNSFEVTDFSNLVLSSGLIEVSTDNSFFVPFLVDANGTIPLGGIEVAANETIFVRTSGTFSTNDPTGLIRVNNLNVAEVPGPLGVLGLGAAFGLSRQLKKKTSSYND